MQGDDVKTKQTLVLLAMIGALGLAPPAARAERLGSYIALKGGVYSPSATFTLENLDVETTFDGDTELGAAGELAFGHYFLPTFALEAAAGYFQGRGSVAPDAAAVTRNDVNFNVIPILVTAKALIPIGVVDPYGELGVGAYFTKVEVSDNLNTFSGTTTYGLHTGGGLNINITKNAFIGAEGRYVWANPSFGDEKIKLNDTEYALNGFKLNGFTTTLVLGFSF
jgi:outer membrane protein W